MEKEYFCLNCKTRFVLEVKNVYVPYCPKCGSDSIMVLKTKSLRDGERKWD